MSVHHEELQEIENVKYYWKRGGKWVFGILLAAALGYLMYVFYNNYKTNQSYKAAELASKISNGQTENLTTLQNDYPDTAVTAQATLEVAARLFNEKKYAESESTYRWLFEHTKMPLFYTAAAQNLVNVLLQEKKYDQALQVAATPVETAFQPLLDERRGDVYAAQGKTKEAMTAYQAALDKLPEDAIVRDVIEAKRNQL